MAGRSWRWVLACCSVCALASAMACTKDFDALTDDSSSSQSSASGATNGSVGSGGAAASSGASTGGAATTTGSAGSTSTTGGAGGTGGQPGEKVYAASQTTLYTFDVATHELATIAAFDGCGAVREIAMDGSKTIFAEGPAGGGLSALYSIDATTAACTLIIDDAFVPKAIGFVPPGAASPSDEVLVAHSGADYFRIDPATGEVTTVTTGALAAYNGVDIAMGGGQLYAILDKSGCSADCFSTIDPMTGAMLLDPPFDLMHADGIAGLAYSGGSAYAFGRTGDVLQVDPASGEAVVVARTNVMFEGAASPP